MAERHERLTAEADEIAWRLAAARLRVLRGEREARASGWSEGLALRESARQRLEALDEELARLALDRERTSAALADADASLGEASAIRVEAEREVRAVVERVADARAALARAASNA